MEYMFFKATNFDTDTLNWDLSKVENTKCMLDIHPKHYTTPPNQ